MKHMQTMNFQIYILKVILIKKNHLKSVYLVDQIGDISVTHHGLILSLKMAEIKLEMSME